LLTLVNGSRAARLRLLPDHEQLRLL